jgi:hypothetical protein
MNARGSFEHRLVTWLGLGPDTAPSDLVGSVLEDTSGMSQRRQAGLRRLPAGWSIAAAGIVVAITGIGLLSAVTSGPAGPIAASPGSPSPTASSQVLTQTGSLDPGVYAIAGSGNPRVRLVVTVPAGWRSFCGPECFGLVFGPANAKVGIGYFAVDNVYADPCGHALQAPPLGSSVDDLAEALSTLPGTEATTPIATTVDGHPGKYIAFTIRDDIGCLPTQHYLWETASGGKRWAEAIGQKFRLWALDIDGDRMLVQADSLPGASAADLAELDAVVGSIRFGP